MAINRSAKLWYVNVTSFILFAILASTGSINWLLLPRGSRGGGGFLSSILHFLRDVHEWTALLFILTVVVHIVLHWGYIRSRLKK